MEQFQSAGDSLQEMHFVPFGALVCRPRNSADFCHRRESIIQLRDITVCFPGVAPGPVNGDPSSAGSVLSREVSLVISTRPNLATHGFLHLLINSIPASCLYRWRRDMLAPLYPLT